MNPNHGGSFPQPPNEGRASASSQASATSASQQRATVSGSPVPPRQEPVLSVPLGAAVALPPAQQQGLSAALPHQPPTRETTFLTHEPGRAPSAYHVDADDHAQRARQQHRAGAVVTENMPRVQAFTDTWEQAAVVHDLVAESPYRADDALRLEIMDGMASPLLAPGRSHVEAHGGEVRRGNPHISGGTVTFPASGSPLADFDFVANRTNEINAYEQNEQDGVEQPGPRPAYVTSATTHQLNPAAQAFNQRALALQQAFARSVRGVPDEPGEGD